MPTWRVTTSTETFVHLHEELLKYYRAKVDQTADAEDLLGETWLAAGRLFEKRSSLRNYLYAIARGLLTDYWRAVKRQRPYVTESINKLPSDSPSQDEWLIARRNHEVIQRGLESVPEVYRGTVDLWLRGFNNFEIAKELGITYHTARSRLARGKAALIAAILPQLEP